MRAVTASYFSGSNYPQNTNPPQAKSNLLTSTDHFSMSLKSAERHVPKFGAPIPDYMEPVIERSRKYHAENYSPPYKEDPVKAAKFRQEEDRGEAAQTKHLAKTKKIRSSSKTRTSSRTS